MSTAFHHVEGVEFAGTDLVLRTDGKVYRVAVTAVSDRLAHASEAARRFYRVSPSGFGIHWPEVDEDLSVDGLIQAAAGNYPAAQPNAMILKEEKDKQ